MKPTIEIDQENKLIITNLKKNMSKADVYEFIDDLHCTLAGTNASEQDYTLLNNATEKSFAELDSARELADSFRKLLSDNHVKKFAVYRPQDDYYSENQADFPDKFKTFSSVTKAKDWLIN